MTILAFDTASETLALGLSVNGAERFFLEISGNLRHSELIMGSVDTLLATAGIAKTDLEAVACMEGPGSFTGLRIGFAAAKGLSMALDIPIITVPTLDCMAYSFSFWPGVLLPLIDAKKNSFFTALYRRGNRLSSYLDIDIDSLLETIKNNPSFSSSQSLLLTGPAVPLALPSFNAAFPGTSACGCKRGYAAELLKLAEETGIVSLTDAAQAKLRNSSCGPLYLRKSDAELNNMDKQNG